MVVDVFVCLVGSVFVCVGLYCVSCIVLLCFVLVCSVFCLFG